MALTQADLDAAIQAQNAVVTDLATKVTKIAADVDALLAKITTGTPVTDLTNEVQALQSQTAALTTAAGQLSAADTKANS